MPDDITRSTRSGRTFASWNASSRPTIPAQCDIANLVQDAYLRAEMVDLGLLGEDRLHDNDKDDATGGDGHDDDQEIRDPVPLQSTSAAHAALAPPEEHLAQRATAHQSFVPPTNDLQAPGGSNPAPQDSGRSKRSKKRHRRPSASDSPQNPDNHKASPAATKTDAAASSSGHKRHKQDADTSARTGFQKASGHRNRNKKRKAARDAAGLDRYLPRPETTKKFVTNANAVQSNWHARKAHVTKTAFIGLRDPPRERRCHTLSELVGPDSLYKFTLVPYRNGEPIPIVTADDEQYVLGVMAGRPQNHDWDSLATDAAALLDDARREINTPDEETEHRRGHFAVVDHGISFGGGQKKPRYLNIPAHEAPVVEKLLKEKPFRRLAGFASSVMATWAPRMFAHYTKTFTALYDNDPSLPPPDPPTVFPGQTYNEGPETVCYRHFDHANFAAGWCAITALGDFDHTQGGHLVLWELGLVLEFPPGATILIPSAVISHSNTALPPGQRRYSFTQYAAGGIFRWVHNGFQRSVDFWDGLSKAEYAAETLKAQNRWKDGLAMWSRLDELAAAPGQDAELSVPTSIV